MYALSYFRTEAEAMHLAVSEDGYAWEAVDDGEPVLEGDVGAESLRDPFLYRDRADVYHLLATDGWRSTNVVHATSEDLVSWSDQELLPVMGDVPGSRNSWAPECFYDRAGDVHRLVWSSTVNDDPSDDSYDHRIWTCSTPDFERFSASSCLFDPGYEVIDACVVFDDERDEYAMAFKDERGANSVDTDHKDIHLATAPSGGGPFRTVAGPVTPAPVEGPTIVRTDGEWLALYDHFIEGHYGASRSPDLREWTTCSDEVSFPDGVRHGSVLEVPDDTGRRVLEAY